MKDKEKNRAYHAEYRAANREKILAQHKAWRAKNPRKNPRNLQKKRDIDTAWRKKNRIRICGYAAKYYATHRDKIRAKSTKWRDENCNTVRAKKQAQRAANPEQHRAYDARWRAKNSEELRFRHQKRRALKRGVTIGTRSTIIQWEKSWRRKKFAVCYWCSLRFTIKKCHLDHIKPLSKGGAHSIENLCISCAHCNLSKNAKSLFDWNKCIAQPVLL